MPKIRHETSSTPLIAFLKQGLYKVKTCGQRQSFNIFWAPRLGHTKKTNFKIFQTADPEICSISNCSKRVWDKFLSHIFSLTFEEKYFLCYIPLTDQITLSGCLYFL